jgi:Domain of unknown function (DUF6265)
MRTPGLALISWLLLTDVATADEPLNLNWLAGAWCSAADGRTIEEHWLSERGGLMLGVNRTISSRKTTFEFLRIEIIATGARYIAQPGGAPPIVFDLTGATSSAVTFANPQHDFPRRVRYQRDGNVLTARIDDGRDAGAAEEFRWTPCSAARAR